MKELVAKINEAFEAFSKDAALQVEKGNKAAGTRARKASLELEKLMKEFPRFLSRPARTNLFLIRVAGLYKYILESVSSSIAL